MAHSRPPTCVCKLTTGALNVEGQVSKGAHVDLALRESDCSRHLYEGELNCPQSGSCGFSVRVVPFNEDALVPYELPWVKWAD